MNYFYSKIPILAGIFFIIATASCNTGNSIEIIDLSNIGDIPDRVPETSDNFKETECWYKFTIPKNVHCGILTVPENYHKPEGKKIELAVVRFFSDNKNVQKDPIVYLEGGPGGSGIKTTAMVESIFSKFIGDRDLIVFDQRGTGVSQPALDCETSTSVSGEMDINDTKVCKKNLLKKGISLKEYNSAANAHDVDSLRKALGYKQINLWGISYGTRLALTVMRDYPQGIRSVILDSTVPLEINLYENLGVNASNSFNKLFDQCGSQPKCNTEYPDIMHNMLKAMDELDKTPHKVTIEDGSSVDLTGDMLMNLLFVLMYSADNLPYIPLLVTSIYNQNYIYIDDIMKQVSAQGSGISLGMNLSVNCSEEYAYFNKTDYDNASKNIDHRFYNVFNSDDIGEACKEWDVPAAPKKEITPVKSDIPTMIIAGIFDPITPPEWGKMVADNLTNSQFFTFPNGTHGVSITDCGQAMSLQFFKEPTHNASLKCFNSLQPKSFLYPLVKDTKPLIDFASPESSVNITIPPVFY